MFDPAAAFDPEHSDALIAWLREREEFRDVFASMWDEPVVDATGRWTRREGAWTVSMLASNGNLQDWVTIGQDFYRDPDWFVGFPRRGRAYLKTAPTGLQIAELLGLLWREEEEIPVGILVDPDDPNRHPAPRRPGPVHGSTQTRLTSEQKQQVADLYEAGSSTAKLGKQFECSPRTIARIVRERGGTLRNPGFPSPA